MSSEVSNRKRTDQVAASRLPLWIATLLSFVGYVVLSFWFPLRPYFNHSPSPDIRSLAPTLSDAFVYAFLLCALFGLYLFSYHWVRRVQISLPLSAILLVAGLFCIPLLFAFPVNATDVYRYFLRGRITSLYRESPYLVTVADIEDEPYRSLAGEWVRETSPYGPVWESTAAVVTRFVGDDLLLALIFFKGLAASTLLALGGLIWLALEGASRANRAAITLLWAWNPALLLIFAMDGHNDGLMLVWLLLGWWFLLRGQRVLGLVFMLLAPLTKPVGLLPIPYFYLASWRKLPRFVDKAGFALFSVLAALVLTWVAFLPFGSPVVLGRRLLSEAASGGGFSLLAAFILQVQHWGVEPPIGTVTAIAALLFGLFAVWLLWRTWLGRSSLRAAADVFFAYIVQAFRFRIWYAAWPFPWLLLDHGQSESRRPQTRARLAAGIGLLLTSQLSVIIYGQLRTLVLGSSQRRAHLIGVSFTILLPLVVAFLVYAYSVRSAERQKEK